MRIIFGTTFPIDESFDTITLRVLSQRLPDIKNKTR